jgi:hypothetical protein
VNKINEEDTTRSSPEPLADLMPLDHLSALPMQMPPPCCQFDELALKPTDGEHVYNDVMDKDEEKSVGEHSHKDLVAHVLPIDMPAPPVQATSLRLQPDEPTPDVKTVARRQGLSVAGPNCTMNNEYSPTAEAAQKQSEDPRTPSRGAEGTYLA